MKLNNSGWSMKEMIIFSSILLVFLLIAVFNIMRLYHGLNPSTENNKGNSNINETKKYSYEDLEEKLLDAGLDYFNEYTNSDENVKIKTEQLIKTKLLTSSDLMPEDEKKECKGYVLFENGEPFSFIHCQNYETNGYEE